MSTTREEKTGWGVSWMRDGEWVDWLEAGYLHDNEKDATDHAARLMAAQPQYTWKPCEITTVTTRRVVG